MVTVEDTQTGSISHPVRMNTAQVGLHYQTLYVGFALLSLEAVLARGMIEECDVISVVTKFMVGSRFGSRYD
jgi:hypothetical protein